MASKTKSPPRSLSPRKLSHRPASVLGPKVASLTEQGNSIKQIAAQLGISERHVSNLRSWAQTGEGELTKFVAREPVLQKDFDKLPKVVQECLEKTPLGFKRFYERYSGFYLPDHCLEWIRLHLENPRLLINVPPRHAKSEVMTVWVTIWKIALDRNVQILVISDTITGAYKFCRKIAVQLEKNELLISDLGYFQPPTTDVAWRPAKGELLVAGRERLVETGDLTVQARGATQQVLGMEADYIVCDDIVGRGSATSAVERETLSEHFHGDILSRQSPRADVVVIGQRLHLKDLYGELADQRWSVGPRAGEPFWTHVNFPAVLDWEKQEVLWPREWPFDKLMERYEALKRGGSSFLFESMYQQNPVPEEEMLVKRSWIFEEPGALDDEREIGYGLDPADRRCRVFSLDPSPTAWAGIVIADIAATNHFRCVVLEARRRHLGPQETLEEVWRAKQYYGIDYFLIERNAAIFLLSDPTFLNRISEMGVMMVQHKTHDNKNHPIYGLKSLAGDFEMGQIRIPYGNMETRQEVGPFLDELLEYPFGDTNDMLMALWFIKYNYKRLVPVGVQQGGKKFQGFGHQFRGDPRSARAEWEKQTENPVEIKVGL